MEFAVKWMYSVDKSLSMPYQDILSVEWNESELENDDLENYKAKAELCVCWSVVTCLYEES